MKRTDDIAFDLELAIDSVESFSDSCDVGCTIIDNSGRILFEKKAHGVGGINCRFCHRLSELTGSPLTCANFHADSSKHAVNFGGRYIYFCPSEMAYFSSPITMGDKVTGTLIGGPVLLINKDEYISEEIIYKNGLSPEFTGEFQDLLRDFRGVSPSRLSHMSNLLFILSVHISGADRRALMANETQLVQQQRLNEHIQELKASRTDVFYPLETEKSLITAITNGDRATSLSLINEILGYIFFKIGDDFSLIRTRIIEILALISRAAIDGGADPEFIFSLNHRFSNEIDRLNNINDITYWFSGVITRFTDMVFQLIDVKYKDIIYKAISYLNKNYMNKITLEDTAQYVGFSASYFSKVFKNETGQTFSQYLNELRVTKSKALLLSLDIPLSQVSQLSGFEDQSYFSKIFRKFTGVTPKKYREFRGRLDTSKERSV